MKRVLLSIYFITTFMVSQAVFASAMVNSCRALFNQQAVTEKELLLIEPHFLVSKDIKSSNISVEIGDRGDYRAKLIEPAHTSVVNKLAVDLAQIDTALIVVDDMPTSGVFTTAVSYTLSNGTNKTGSAIVLKSTAFNGTVLEHEMFHALNFYKMKNDIRTVFDGVISPNSYRDLIQPNWNWNLVYKRLTGEDMSGELIASKFRSAYEEIDIEEVRTFVIQLKRRTVNSKNTKALFSESEMGDTLVPAQFFVKNFKKFSALAAEQLESYVRNQSHDELINRMSFTTPDYAVASDPRIVKRKITFYFDNMSYTFENLPKAEYQEIVRLLKNKEKSKIPSVVLPFMRKKLKQQSELAHKIDIQFDNYLNKLNAVKNRQLITEAESKELNTALQQLVNALN